MMTVNKFDLEVKIYLYIGLYVYIHIHFFCVCVSLGPRGCDNFFPLEGHQLILSGDLDDVAEQRRKNKQQEQEATA